MEPVEKDSVRLLREAQVRSEPKTSGMAKEILKLESALFTFVTVEGMEPTNNFAERQVRCAVQWRKTSFGTQSPAGSRAQTGCVQVAGVHRPARRAAWD